jgi:hypothetical protein
LYSIRPRTGTDEFVFFVVFAFEFQLKSFKFKPLFLILTKSFSIQLVFQPLDFQLQPLDFQLQPLDFQLQPLDFQLQPISSSSSSSSLSISSSSSSSFSVSSSSSSSFDQDLWETWRDENEWKAKKKFYFTLTGNTYNIAFVVADPESLDSDRDTPVYNYLTADGHTVTYKAHDDETYNPITFDCIVISDSCTSANLAWLKTAGVGILTLDSYNYDEFELGTGNVETPTDDDIRIKEPTHYITDNYLLNQQVEIATATTNLGAMTGWAQDVSDLAQSWDTASEAWILAVDKDETLQGGVNTAAERRVYLGAAFSAI